jgi:hypothetical protein
MRGRHHARAVNPDVPLGHEAGRARAGFDDTGVPEPLVDPLAIHAVTRTRAYA